LDSAPETEKKEQKSTTATQQTVVFETDPSLPPDWKIVQSSKGDKYYYNVTTRESTWKIPTSEKYFSRFLFILC
jgi:hypothetical protein